MFVDKVHITIYKMFVGSDRIRNSLSTNTIYKRYLQTSEPSAIYKHYLQTNTPYLQTLPTNDRCYLQTP